MMKPRRVDEGFAQESFSRLLLSRRSTAHSWGAGSEPPDFWLNLQEERVAVEITQLMEEITIGDRRLSHQGANAALWRFVKSLEREAREAKLLNGLYHIHVCPVPELWKVSEELKSRVFAYLKSTILLPSAPRRELWTGEDGKRWTIQKLRDGSGALEPSMSLGNAKWEGEIREDLRRMLAERLADKRKKMHHLAEPVVLLVIDAYHYGDAELWRQAANELDLTGFHTVARVYGEYRCQILCSANQEWR